MPSRRLVPGVPRDLETVCLKCLEKDPARRRYSTAGELADDLARYARGEPVAARAATPLERLIKAIGRSEHDRQLRSWGTSILALGPALALPTAAVTGLALWSLQSLQHRWAVGLAVMLTSSAAALMPIAPAWGPFGFGLLLLVIFTPWGLHLRRLGRDDPG